MMKSRYLALVGIIILLIANCTKPYTPTKIANAPSYLVVEGVINTGSNDSTLIKLSRTVPLSAGVGTTPELNAIIIIQSDNNQTYNLHELGDGKYVSDNLSLDNTHKYRLSINTADGKNYVSDYLTPVPTPPIDSVGFIIKSNGLQLYANTHDPNNKTHYYRWDYIETWQFHAKYFSSYISNGINDVVPRTPSQYIYQCWGNSISNDIILGSSAKLTSDVIYQNPITFVESTSEKIESRYSILVKQYALSSAGYNYFEQLRQNTEELGGIFDPQPSQLTGNVHCTTDAAIPAIGYVAAGTIQQKRVYINNSQLPISWLTVYPYDCREDTALYDSEPDMNEVLHILVPLPATQFATEPYYGKPAGPTPAGYFYSDAMCVDCSIRGTLIKPNFWTNQ